jgi:ATP phosphoribosyltransferase regulatory subunit
LAATAGLSTAQEDEFFDLLQRKAMTEIRVWIDANVNVSAIAELLIALPNMAGDKSILVNARARFLAVAPAAATAVDQLAAVAAVIEQRYPEAEMYFDLGELRGYHYLTGMVFAAFAPGYGNPIASGGRYDQIGEVFGRARPATGFAVDITAVSKLGLLARPVPDAILAVTTADPRQWQAIQALRAQGERVVASAAAADAKDLGCNRQLLLAGEEYKVVSL